MCASIRHRSRALLTRVNTGDTVRAQYPIVRHIYTCPKTVLSRSLSDVKELKTYVWITELLWITELAGEIPEQLFLLQSMFQFWEAFGFHSGFECKVS